MILSFGQRTVAYMLSDQLGTNIRNLVGNADPTRADFGFGLGLAVRTTPGVVRLMGSVGQFTWPGASGTDWWVDPKEDLVVVYLSAAPGPIPLALPPAHQRAGLPGDRGVALPWCRAPTTTKHGRADVPSTRWRAGPGCLSPAAHDLPDRSESVE